MAEYQLLPDAEKLLLDIISFYCYCDVRSYFWFLCVCILIHEHGEGKGNAISISTSVPVRSPYCVTTDLPLVAIISWSPLRREGSLALVFLSVEV